MSDTKPQASRKSYTLRCEAARAGGPGRCARRTHVMYRMADGDWHAYCSAHIPVGVA